MMKKFLLISFLIISIAGFGQNSKPEDKIDPVFLFLISQQKSDRPSVKHKSSSYIKLKKSKAGKPADASVRKTYDCIIYTKKAEMLRKKGILVNSELPNFVTAIITLEQVTQLSLMPEVTYIEASKENHLH